MPGQGKAGFLCGSAQSLRLSVQTSIISHSSSSLNSKIINKTLPSRTAQSGAINSRSNRDKSVSKPRGSVGKQNGGVANVSGCDSVFTNKDEKLVVCSLCINTHCIACIDMTSHEYDALQKLARDDVIWLCPGCLNTVKATKSIQTETQKTVPEFKHEIAQRFESLEKK